MSLSLRRAEIQRVETLAEFQKAARAVKYRELVVAAFSIHDPSETPLRRLGLHNLTPIGLIRTRRIDEVSGGQYSGSIHTPQRDASLLTRVDIGLVFSRAPRGDIGAHIDPTTKKPVASQDSVPYTHHYTALGNGIVRAALVDGDKEDLLQLDGLTSLSRAAAGLREEFDRTAASFDFRQGDVLAFLSNGQVLENGTVVPQTMHDFITDPCVSIRTSVIRPVV